MTIRRHEYVRAREGAARKSVFDLRIAIGNSVYARQSFARSLVWIDHSGDGYPQGPQSLRMDARYGSRTDQADLTLYILYGHLETQSQISERSDSVVYAHALSCAIAARFERTEFVPALRPPGRVAQCPARSLLNVPAGSSSAAREQDCPDQIRRAFGIALPGNVF